MKVTKVGCPILADYSQQHRPSTENVKSIPDPQHMNYAVTQHTKDRRPIITPLVGGFSPSGGGIGRQQQYLLIPQGDRIRVLSMEQGELVTELLPHHNSSSHHDDDDTGSDDDEDDSHERTVINTVAIIRVGRDTPPATAIATAQSSALLLLPNPLGLPTPAASPSSTRDEYVVLAGTEDGTLHEWPLSAVATRRAENGGEGGVLPSRVFRLPVPTGEASWVSHVAAMATVLETATGVFYALLSTRSVTRLLRVVLPPLDCDSGEGDCEIVELIEDDEEVTQLTEYFGGSKKLPILLSCSTVPIRQDMDMDMDMEKGGAGKGNTKGGLKMLTSKSTSGLTSRHCMVTVCMRDKFQIIYDNGTNSASIQNFTICSEITAAATSPNGSDLAIGLKSGVIHVYVTIYNTILQHLHNNPPTHLNDPNSPSPLQHKLIYRQIHWHALPVQFLSYTGLPTSRAPPNLLSGGEESVLLTWNFHHGFNRPIHTLPRLSGGCLTHVATNPYPGGDAEDLVVASADGTLRVVEGISRTMGWVVRGIASAENECVPLAQEEVCPRPVRATVLGIDGRTGVPVMTRLGGAPGFVQWFDPRVGRVVGELEVAPYNRISRRNVGQRAYPRPEVTCLAMGDLGHDMVTVDVMVTSNGQGVVEALDGCGKKSVNESCLTVIKFWAWNKHGVVGGTKGEKDSISMPYELISSMPSPHGVEDGMVDAMAMSPDGCTSCSLSNRGGAFHIWRKISVPSPSPTPARKGGGGKKKGGGRGGKKNPRPPVPAWKRECRISIPAGSANAARSSSTTDGDGAVAFSPDGTVLAVAFGRHVTVWDHVGMAVLHTVSAPERIRDVGFLVDPKDMLLAVGGRSVSSLPPFGGGYTGGAAWSYTLPDVAVVDGYEVELGPVAQMRRGGAIAAAIRMERVTKGAITDVEDGASASAVSVRTKIVLIDAASGSPKIGSDGTPVYWTVRGDVECLCDISHLDTGEWTPHGDGVLLALTYGHEIFVLSTDDRSTADAPVAVSNARPKRRPERIERLVPSSDGAPVLPAGKRMRGPGVEGSGVGVDFASSVVGGLGMIEGTAGGAVPTSRLPKLSGAFTSAFLGERFRKKDTGSS